MGFKSNNKLDNAACNKAACNKAPSEEKLKSVFDFMTYSRETGFSFSYAEVVTLIGLIGASNEIDTVSKFDNSLSFGAKQNALRQMFFAL